MLILVGDLAVYGILSLGALVEGLLNADVTCTPGLQKSQDICLSNSRDHPATLLLVILTSISFHTFCSQIP